MLQKRLFFCCLALLCCLSAFAQNKIALEHNGVSSFFNDIPTAVTAAVNGDTIYLPGGFFPGFAIDKGITVIGVGHHPDSTAATSRTQIIGTIHITHTADNCSLSGLLIQDSILIDDYQGGELSGINISRCHIGGPIDAAILVSNSIISENMISGNIVFAAYHEAQNMVISNNIMNGILRVSNSIIQNNIIFSGIYSSCYIYACYYQLLDINYCTINNCIFSSISNFSGYSISTQYCNFYNNINLGSNGNTPNNIGPGNIQNVDFNTLFVQNAGLNYSSDFHLVDPSYNTGGSDGTPIGIYGGMFPWKAGSVPFNPHINLKVIAPTTNNSGNLPVQIRVRAQNN